MKDMTEQITIDRRFNGPPNSGHGGYVCGTIATYIGSCAEITLRAPPPVSKPLTVERLEGGKVRLSDAEATIAEGRPAELRLKIPDPPTLEESVNAAKAFPGFESHPFPTCFACGHERPEGDGLRIFSAPLTGREVLAAPWLPDASLADETGRVGTEFLWAALDCPGGWAAWKLVTVVSPETPYILLGRFVAEVKAQLETGQKCITIGWPIGNDGRKLFSGSAIFAESGELLAVGRTTWITGKPVP
jgi:hypothetical protein